MRGLMLILFVLLSQVLYGQIGTLLSISLPHKSIDTSLSLKVYNGYVSVDSNAIKRCKERGHIQGAELSGSTLMYCPDYVIDTDSTSILVHPACNSTWYTCGRCRQHVSEGGKETREIIWKKKELIQFKAKPATRPTTGH